jgi:hypothetical protein
MREGSLCVDSVDQQATVACGKLYGTDPHEIVGARLDLYPTKFLPVTRLRDGQSNAASAGGAL